MKLLIDTKAGKVLFAEAEKDCVDFHFHILSLPVGTVGQREYYAYCPECDEDVVRRSTINVAPPAATSTGFVTYMVMDDLVITPMSTISSITLLNKFNVEDVAVLHEKVVHFGMEEALKASFESKAVLTSLFMSSIQAEK
ncbi:hypothetical protein MTR67_028721 [Solanum verrucosum]|uniref:Uncharacterized protein n=1 Tax=Solanum verrucosum TaxID=315347 RepID=A0AAF0RBM2_SOLVR|nr:hypothetical protein MTR67_028721 [Solanum verrucosum]